MAESRLSQVYRAWQSVSGTRSFAATRDWWAASDGESMGLGLACLALIVSVPLEVTLWGLDWDPIGFRRAGGLPGTAVAGALGGIWAVNAWCWDRLLRRRLVESGGLRAPVRVGRSLIAGFPGLGLTSLPLWKSWAARAPAWAYGSTARSRRQRSPGWMRPLRLLLPEPSGRAVLFLWLAGLVTLLLAAVWLSAPRNLVPGRRALLLAGAICLHGLGLLGTVAYVQTLACRGGSRRHLLWAGAWFLPLPLTLAAFAPIGFDLATLRQETLTWTAHARRGQSGRLRQWSELERSLRSAWGTSPWWRRWGRPMGRRIGQGLPLLDRRLLAVCRGKVALLLGDGLLLGWLLHAGGLDLEGPPVFGFVALVAFGGAAGGLVVLSARNLLAAVRLMPEPPPLGWHRQIWFGATAVASLGLGLLVGSALAGGQHREGGLLFTYGATAALLVVALGYILRSPLVPWSPEGAGAGLGWCALLFALMVVGGCVAALPGAAAVFIAAGFAMPLWHGLFFLATWSSLRRCFEPSSAHTPSHRSFMRQKVSATPVTALLPLGGLAVSGWLRQREHLRRSGGGQ